MALIRPDELPAATPGAKWGHSVNVDDTTDSPQGTSQRVKYIEQSEDLPDIVLTPTNWADKLPTPVGDVITLTSGSYSCKGYVDISPNRLAIPAFTPILFKGTTSLKDTLASTCVGGGFISGDKVLLGTQNISLEASSAEWLLDITGVGSNVIMHFTDFFDYKKIGRFTDITYLLYDNGFTTTTANSIAGFLFQGTTGVLLFTHFQSQKFINTLIDLGTCTFVDFLIDGGIVGIDRTDATQLIVSGLPNNGNVNIPEGGRGRIFNLEPHSLGLGDPLIHPEFSGIEPKDVYWSIKGVPTMQDSRVFFGLQSEGNLTNTVLSADTWAKIVTDNPVVDPASQRYTVNIGNSVEYTGIGTSTHTFNISLSITKVGGGVGLYELAAFKNANGDATIGTKISVIFPIELKNTAGSVTVFAASEMTTGDFIDIYIRPVGHGDDVLVNADTAQIFGG